MRVLLVDDDPIMRRATARMLPRFQVDTVGSAPDALSAVESTPYAAVVIDACLGSFADRGGIELVRELRSRGYPSGIVLVSGIVKEDLEEEGRRAGADAALLKGEFDGSELRMTIERVIAVRNPPAAGDVDELPSELRVLADDVLDVFAQERSIEAEQAYRLALLAQAAFASEERDWSVIEACARAVGLSRQTLQPYATVASRWTAPELLHLLAERRNARGEPISISHLVLLARLSNPARSQWLERVFDEGLTVRQLRELLRSESQE
jgi:DNA-binding response OmpR family regulator